MAHIVGESETSTVFVPIVKATKDPATGFLEVVGQMTGTGLDLDEQRCDAAWLKSTVPAWFASGANVRYMHQPDAVGVGVHLEQDGDDWMLRTLVVDPVAVAKVENKVLTGYSIGIRGPKVVKDAGAPGGRIVGGSIIETSLVDRRALPSAKFTLAKMAGANLVPAAEWSVLRSPRAGSADDGRVARLEHQISAWVWSQSPGVPAATLVKAATASRAPQPAAVLQRMCETERFVVRSYWDRLNATAVKCGMPTRQLDLPPATEPVDVRLAALRRAAGDVLTYLSDAEEWPAPGGPVRAVVNPRTEIDVTDPKHDREVVALRTKAASVSDPKLADGYAALADQLEAKVAGTSGKAATTPTERPLRRMNDGDPDKRDGLI